MVGYLTCKQTKSEKYNCESNYGQSTSTSAYFFNSSVSRSTSKCIFGSYVAIFTLTVLASLVLFMPLLQWRSRVAFNEINEKEVPCGNSCRFHIVETIPEGLIYKYNNSQNHIETADIWTYLIENANSSIEIASFYWTLRENETYPHPSSVKGEKIYQALITAGLKRNVTIRIAQNEPTTFQDNPDTEYLEKIKAAQVRSLNFTKLMGAGVLHTKFWIVDRKHVYVGSANMDWRALTQVKELGAAILDCPCIADDLSKIFEVYWYLGESEEVPSQWPRKYSTQYNALAPFHVKFNNRTNLAYFSSSPPAFCPNGRTRDIDALLKTISSAEKFIYIAVMDYFPLKIYSKKTTFWPIIDNEIRRAVIDRGVNVRILVSQWKNTNPMIYHFMNSLKSLNKFNKKVQVEVKKFKVPASPDEDKIPFARVNHNKYMVTDNGVFIGTSNWSADYFIYTAGVSLIMTTSNTTDDTIRVELLDVFERDWFSSYARDIF